LGADGQHAVDAHHRIAADLEMQVGSSTLRGNSQEIVYVHWLAVRGSSASAAHAPLRRDRLLSFVGACGLGLKSRPTGASRSYRLQGLTRIDEGQPAVTVGRFAVDHVEERDLQGFRDRPALPFANLNLVDAADRPNLCGRADKEGLIADVQHFAGEDLLNDGKAEILRQ